VNDLHCECSSHARTGSPRGMAKEEPAGAQDAAAEADERQQLCLLIAVRIPAADGANGFAQGNLFSATGADHGSHLSRVFRKERHA
jgi:hypothetical protein